MSIDRSTEVNASWDGRHTLTIGTPDTLDADDCLAQIILHEACHALIEGPDSLRKPDWGLESLNPQKKVHEHACLRLQAVLADRHGMRHFFASTTVFRRYYDQIPQDALSPSGDPAVELARAAINRPESGEWLRILDHAIHRTSLIARAVNDIADADSLWSSA
ncbi:MAG: hypothetical protein ACK58L_14015 [Planctomycetota bacterium]